MMILGRFLAFWRKIWSPYQTLDEGAVRGGVLVFSSRILIKGAYFIKTIILARLLFPEDFGLFGLAAVALGIFDLFQPGFNAAIVQEKGDVRKYLSSVWTANILRHSVFALLIVFIAPYYSAFFEQPELTNLVRVLALSVLFTGFENTGIILIQKELLFRRKFLFDLSYVISEIVIVLIAAYYLRSPWALVVGSLGNRVASVFFSFVFHPFRPKLELNWSYIAQLFRYGKWLWGVAIISFIMSRGDTLVVGKLLGPESVGYYQLALGLALLPSVEIARVLNNVLFPYFAKLQNDVSHIRHAFIENVRLVFALVWPITLGFVALGHEFITLVYGTRWAGMVPIASVVIFLGILRTFEYLVNSLMQGAGKPYVSTKSLLCNALVTFTIIIPFVETYGVQGAVYALLIGSMCAQAVSLYALRRHFSIPLLHVLGAVTYALPSGILMFVFIEWLLIFSRISDGFAILIGVPLGALIYFMILFFMDRMLGARLLHTITWLGKNS